MNIELKCDSFNALLASLSIQTKFFCIWDNIEELSFSKSTARRQRSTARSGKAASIKDNFTCNAGQVNFDGRLLSEFGGFRKVIHCLYFQSD